MGKNIRFFLIIFLGCMFSLPLMAQKSSSAAEKEWTQLDQLGIIHDDGTIAPLVHNHQDRFQMQARERKVIDQSNGSQVIIEQKGEGNTTEWFHDGSNNTFSLTQDGNRNVHEGTLRGEDNLIQVLQQGNNNVLKQEIVGNSMDLEYSQYGNEHELIHIEKSGVSPAYHIRQEGMNGMKVKIEHERY